MYNSHYQGLVSSGSSPTKINRKKVFKLFFILFSFKNSFKRKKKCKRKKKTASSALKFVRSKTIMHIDFSKDKLLTTGTNTQWSITWSKNGKLRACLYSQLQLI